MPFLRQSRALRAALLLSLATLPFAAAAQTDEIEVYDAAIADLGKYTLTVHGNYTPAGPRQPAFPGGVTPDHALNGALEWAYGAAGFLELGLYLPVYTVTNRGNPQLDGAKFRTLWVVPHARQREFFYGVNFEFSYNLHHWEASRNALEIRPIAGLHEGPWDFILNPVLDYDYKGIGSVHFAPAERLAYNLSQRWAFGLEHYADLGEVGGFAPAPQQQQTVFAVADYSFDEANSLELGVGRGFTASSDHEVLKLILNHNF
jgi:hypothetical protein